MTFFIQPSGGLNFFIPLLLGKFTIFPAPLKGRALFFQPTINVIFAVALSVGNFCGYFNQDSKALKASPSF